MGLPYGISNISGKISLKKPTLQTYPSIVNKYGVAKVGRDCQVEDLYEEQKEDELDV